jgi:hypothetical protein
MNAVSERISAAPVARPDARSGQLPEPVHPDHVDGEAFGGVLAALGRRVDQGERLIQRASKGNLGTLDAAALIAVQAGIYRYVEAVDLASKLVDRASNAVRSVLQSNQ